MISGIYLIKNKINSKVYVGSSKNIKRRWNTHRKTLTNGDIRRCNKYLCEDWTKLGIENFEFIILEECNIELFKDRENYWIEHYDSRNLDKGYNINDAFGSREVSDETRQNYLYL